MKIKGYTLALACIVMLAGCSDLKIGNRFLEKAPGTDVTIDTIFSSKMYAERALVSAYATLRTPLTVKANDAPAFEHQQAGNKLGWDNLDALTDIIQSHCEWGGVFSTYYGGTYSAETENESSSTKMGFYPSQDVTWTGIRKAWLFIENVDRVPDMTDEEKAVRKAEAKMVIACQYHELLRHFGGVPLLYGSVDSANSLDVDFSRKTFSQTVEFILNLCDEAAADLPWRVSAADDGRFCAAGALGLKIRVLLLAARPLFNADEPYGTPGQPYAGNVDKIHPEDIPYMTWYGNYDPSRWQRVVDACEKFFRENMKNGSPFHLVYPAGSDTEAYREAFSGCYVDRYNSEMLIETFRNMRTFGESYHRMYFGPSTDINGNTGRGYGGGCISLNFVDLFPYIDGSPASYRDWIASHDGRGTLYDNPFTGRDPRLYETVMIVGDHFQARPAEMWIGGTERDVQSNGRAITGFMLRKFLWDYNNATFHTRPANCSYLRMAEIHLAYAEALNETGQKEAAYGQLNIVRSRVGLPDMDDALLAKVQAGRRHPSYPECSLAGDASLREEILDERARELGFEEVRWFDITGWKREDIFREDIYGIDITLDSGSVAEDNIVLGFSEPWKDTQRYWAREFSPKWYMSAFPSNELNKGYGLVQNPGW
ncbi:MAG: RagB/SusD family nutrient uptake outer membrane protein [Clostridium sp.]|nr:RagB/SusD family nutrient uptake outer membrane protein [Bacteroides sp.]MCM1197357.1 RagB/SusD family nutrient uptake outer membrane protein [Clostridium sp.]